MSSSVSPHSVVFSSGWRTPSSSDAVVTFPLGELSVTTDRRDGKARPSARHETSLHQLPEIIEAEILSYLDYTSLARYEQCSRSSRNLAQVLWRENKTLDKMYTKIEGNTKTEGGRLVRDGKEKLYLARLVSGIKKGLAERKGECLERTCLTHQSHLKFGSFVRRALDWILVRDTPLAITTKRSLDRSRFSRFLSANREDCRKAMAQILLERRVNTEERRPGDAQDVREIDTDNGVPNSPTLNLAVLNELMQAVVVRA